MLQLHNLTLLEYFQKPALSEARGRKCIEYDKQAECDMKVFEMRYSVS